MKTGAESKDSMSDFSVISKKHEKVFCQLIASYT